MLIQLILIQSVTDSNTTIESYKQALEQYKQQVVSVSGVILYDYSLVIHYFEGEVTHVHDIYSKLTKTKNEALVIFRDEKPIYNTRLKQSGIQLKKISSETKHELVSQVETNQASFLQALVGIANTLGSEGGEFDPGRLEYFQAADPQEQKDNTNFFEFCTEVAADEVFLMRSDSQIVYVNHSACKKLGYEQHELIGMYVWEWDPLFPKEVWPGFWREFVEKKHLHFETQHKKKTGEVFPVEIHAHLFTQKTEQFLLAFVNDISERKLIQDELLKYKLELETALESKERHIHTIFELASDGIHILDENGDVIECNAAFADLLGYTKDEALQLNVKDWDAEIPKSQLKNVIKQLLVSPKAFHTRHKRKDGTVFDVEVNARGITLSGKIYLYASSRDITQRMKDQREIERLAKTDQLTGLANRHEFMSKFEQYFSMAKREQTPLSLVFIDLDNFKAINDKYGHLVGDDVLVYCGKIIKNNCRDYDVVARVGGDEFIVLLVHADKDVAVKFIDKVMSKLSVPYIDTDLSINVSMSFGISVYPESAKTMKHLMQKSNKALYRSKRSGRGKFSF